MIRFWILLEVFHLISGDQKCYTNQTYQTGVPEICSNESSFCCFDMGGDYYCCDEDQLWTVLRVGLIIFSILLSMAFFILTFVILFVEIKSNVRTAPITVQMTKLDGKNVIKDDDDSFSVFFGTSMRQEEEPKEKVINTS